jgi:hypothetical protein
MAGEQKGSPAVQARNPVLVDLRLSRQQMSDTESNATYESSRRRGRPTNRDVVLFARRRPCIIIPQRNTPGEGQVEIIVALEHKGRFLAMDATGIVGDLVRRGAALHSEAVGHLHLEQVIPVGAKVHVLGAADFDPVGVDGVVRAGRRGLDACGAVVGPAAGFHGPGGCNSDGRVLRAER